MTRAKCMVPGADTTCNMEPLNSKSSGISFPEKVTQRHEAPPSSSAILDSRMMRSLALIVLTLGVLTGGAMHTLFAQPFKSDLGINNLQVPWFHTFLTMSSWPVAMLAWIIVARGNLRIPNVRWRMRSFLYLSLLDALNIALASFGLNAMSAATFAILRGSGLIFAAGLSLMITSKKFNRFHYAGVVLMSLAMVVMAFTEEDKQMGAGFSLASKISAWICTLVSTFFVSLLGVLTQRMFAEESAKGNLEFICQINAFQATFSFFLSLPIILYQNEVKHWPEYASKMQEEGTFTKMLLFSLGMFLARPLMLFSNIACTSLASATFVKALGGPKRLVVVFCSYFFLNQVVRATTVWAAVLMTGAMLIYVYGGYLQAGERLAERKRKALQDVQVTQMCNHR